jgi:hypothetical protein
MNVADLKIRIMKGGGSEPVSTVTIPGNVLKIASSLLPRKAAAALKEQGIDFEELVALSQNPNARGTLVEIDNHEKNEKVVISLE